MSGPVWVGGIDQAALALVPDPEAVVEALKKSMLANCDARGITVADPVWVTYTSDDGSIGVHLHDGPPWGTTPAYLWSDRFRTEVAKWLDHYIDSGPSTEIRQYLESMKAELEATK